MRQSGFCHQRRRRGHSIFNSNCGALVFGPECTLDHFEIRRFIAGKTLQPVIPGGRILDAIPIAESGRRLPLAVGSRRPAQQSHADLRSEARAQPQRIAHRVVSSLGKVELSKFGVHFFEIGNSRNNPSLEYLDRYHVFYSDSHRMTGRTFGIGDNNLVRGFFKDVPQRKYLGGCAPAAGRSVGFVRDEDGFRGNLISIDSPLRFHIGDQLLHHVPDVAHVEPRPMISTIGDDRTHHVADGTDAALAR